MKTAWTKGLTEQDAEEVASSFRASARLRQRLDDLIYEKLAVNAKGVRIKDAYNNPNWAYLQADAVGYERALFEILSLLEP